eukprot:COSAG02_NODE_12795_length_1491_cov_153.955460_1_plen_76_part_00
MQIRSFLFAVLAMFVLLVGESARVPRPPELGHMAACVTETKGVWLSCGSGAHRLSARRHRLPVREETGLQRLLQR